MSYQFIELDVCDGVATLAFNQPQRRNALGMGMRTEFAHAIETILADDAVRAIVLTGRGGAFCAGGDISQMDPAAIPDAQAGRRRMRNTLVSIERLARCDKPVIAAVDGPAYGAGFGIALLADIVLATPAARFCMSFIRIGLVPDCGAMYTLPRVVGVQRAKELMLTARELDAASARDYGIVLEVVDAAQILPRAQAMARALAGASATAVALTKTGVNQSLSLDLAGMLEYEAAAQGIAFTSPGHRDAAQRFLSRQPPLFQWPAAAPSTSEESAT